MVGLHFLFYTVVDNAVTVASYANFASSVALVKKASVIVVVSLNLTFQFIIWKKQNCW